MPGVGFMNYRRGTAVRPNTIYRAVTKRGRVVRKVRYTKPLPGPAVRQYVRQALRANEETKCIGLAVENGTPHNAGITSSDIVPVLAGMSQGTGSSNRVGDKVKPTILKIKGCVSYYDRGQPNVTSPMIVKVFCLQWKGLRDSSSGFGTVPIGQLMDNGGGTGGWDGSTIRSLWRINTDDFTVLGSKTLKISDTDVENHKSQTGHYEMTVKCPATLTYSPGAIYPANFAPFFVLGWCYEDGSTPSALDVNIVNTAQSFLYYKDA